MKAFLILLLISPLLCSDYSINLTSKNFLDPFGRSYFFHGINVVYKILPLVPQIETYDPITSLCPYDFELIQSWGFNNIRLLISWQGTEVQPGVYNYTYMEQVRSVVRLAAQYNISVLLDMHQDILSYKFCGDGFPMWALNITNFPAPMDIEVSHDASGNPDWNDCNQGSQAKFYLTENVQAQWEEFYSGSQAYLQDHMAAFWGEVANFFKDEPNVMGYEIINEPFSADLYRQPLSIIQPQRDDYKFLQPLYAKVNAAIRKFDNDTIVFFEPIVDDYYSAKLKEGPGGPAYNDKQALSYHIYCWDGNSQAICDAENVLFFNARFKDMQRIGVLGYLTEFGGCGNNTQCYENILQITSMAESHLQSWSYWNYKDVIYGNPGDGAIINPQGYIETIKLKGLTRTYFYATCGVPLENYFNAQTGYYLYSWEPYASCQGANSEFFASQEYFYPNGFNANFTGCDSCVIEALGVKNYYQVLLGNSYGSKITITINPKNPTEVEY